MHTYIIIYLLINNYKHCLAIKTTTRKTTKKCGCSVHISSFLFDKLCSYVSCYIWCLVPNIYLIIFLQMGYVFKRLVRLPNQNVINYLWKHFITAYMRRKYKSCRCQIIISQRTYITFLSHGKRRMSCKICLYISFVFQQWSCCYHH